MQSLISFLIILFTLIHLTGCKNSEESSPLSFIDAYTVDLLETKGTSYAGDYFPVEEG